MQYDQPNQNSFYINSKDGFKINLQDTGFSVTAIFNSNGKVTTKTVQSVTCAETNSRIAFKDNSEIAIEFSEADKASLFFFKATKNAKWRMIAVAGLGATFALFILIIKLMFK